MQDDNQGVMIALLPITTDWCKIECPHMTLVYAGKKTELKSTAFNELAKDASALSMLSRPLMLKVTGVDLFGIEDDVKVFTLRPSSELSAMRRFVDHWNASEHPFNPHVTIGPRDTVVEQIPSYLAFDRIMVGWGDEQLTFSMKR